MAFGEICLRDTAGCPERWFILPARGASHIIKGDIIRYTGFSNLAGGRRKSPATLSICAGYFFVFKILLTDNSVSPM